MTRAKEITKEAKKFAKEIDDWEIAEDVQDAFEAGARWADRTMIDKACEWLYEYNRKQTDKMFGIVNTADVTINVAEFRKAMKSSCSEIPNNHIIDTNKMVKEGGEE